MSKEFICIVCPRGCRINVDDEGNITGNSCPRGYQYVQNELTCPKRMLTSTVRVDSELYSRLPVISSSELPKDLIAKAIRELDKVHVKAPIKVKQVIVSNILDTGVDILATRSLER